MPAEPIPSALDTVIALGVVAAIFLIAAIRAGWFLALRDWLGFGKKEKH